MTHYMTHYMTHFIGLLFVAELESVTLTAFNAVTYHRNTYYDKRYTMTGLHNGRPIYQFSDKATIKWEEFNLFRFGQMAWIVMGSTHIRFVSFSDVNDPEQAVDWKYRTNSYNLIDAPKFYLTNGMLTMLIN